MRFESDGNLVPMLCPGCCTIDDIPDWDALVAAGKFQPLVGCHRCGFTFPMLPEQFKALTLHAMHCHRCEAPEGPERGNWHELGKAIIDGMAGIGEYPEPPPFPPAPRPIPRRVRHGKRDHR